VKRVVAGMMLALLLTGMSVLSSNIEPVKGEWYGTVYIRSDGSVDPPAAPILHEGSLYTLTDGISVFETSAIVIERNDMILDGAGYTLQGYGSGIGVSGGSNNSIKNINIKDFENGIFQVSYSHIYGNNITNAPVWLEAGASSNSIYENNLNGSNIVVLENSSNNISNNVMVNSEIQVQGGYWNTVSGNRMIGGGINVSETGVQGGEIFRNSITNSNCGIRLEGNVEAAKIYRNNITNNEYGIFLTNDGDSYPYNNKFYHNNFIDNAKQVGFSSPEAEHANFWDDGYPSGGNYWSDYEGLDSYSGVFQNDTGSDGIGDTSYNIIENNTDRYPMVSPYPQPPWFPAPRFSFSPPIPTVNQTVNFDASNSFDYDGSVTEYFWDFGDGTNATDTSPTSTHSYGDWGVFTVNLTVTDNEGLKSATAKNISIGRVSSSISLASEHESILFGQSAALGGSIDPLRAGVNVTVWQRFGGQDWSLLESLTTNENSSFSYLWTPTFVETYELKANWTGDDYTYAAESTIVSVTCSPIPTFVSILASCPSTYVGFRVRINGTLLDTYGNPLGNETVVLSYMFQGTETWTPINSDLTDEYGSYEVEWFSPTTGYFVLKTEWAGNSTHAGTNKTATLTILPYEDRFIFSVESNSTISALAFNATDWTLSFSTIGPDGTTGYVRVTAAKALVPNSEKIKVYLDGNQTEFLILADGDSWLLTCGYSQSSHQVQIDFGLPLQGDVNGDLTVDKYDAIMLSDAFGATPGMPNWNSNADINGDNVVDIFDAIILAKNYGKTV
jgi:nitrous oxidase accessory protein NosD